MNVYLNVITRFVLVLVAAFAIATNSGSAAARSLDDIISSKKMRIGIIPVDQMMMRDPNTGKLSGVWIDGIRQLFETLKLEPEFIETKWGTFSGALQAEQIDVFISGFMTPPRALALEYTRPVFFIGHSASTLTENASRFKSIEDLNSEDVTIATVLGGSGHQFAQQFLPKAQIKPLDTGDLTASGMEVLSGRATVALDNAFSVGRFVKLHEDKMVDLFKDDPFNVLPVAWAIKPGNPRLLTFLNNMLEHMDTNGIWESIAANYRNTGLYVVKRDYRRLPARTEE